MRLLPVGGNASVNVCNEACCRCCSVLPVLSEQISPELGDLCVKNLFFIGRAMHLNPHLCFSIGDGKNQELAEEEAGGGTEAEDVEEEGEHQRDAEDEESCSGSDQEELREGTAREAEQGDSGRATGKASSEKDPLRWLFSRMAHMVVHKGDERRCAVFTWFAAMADFHEPAFTAPYLRLMLLPLRRAVLDAEASGAKPKLPTSEARGKAAAGHAAGNGVSNRERRAAAELAAEVGGSRWKAQLRGDGMLWLLRSAFVG